jgi:hypothetical protein
LDNNKKASQLKKAIFQLSTSTPLTVGTQFIYIVIIVPTFQTLCRPVCWRLKLALYRYMYIYDVRCVLCFVILLGTCLAFYSVDRVGRLFQSVTLGHAQLAARRTETRAGGN